MIYHKKPITFTSDILGVGDVVKIYTNFHAVIVMEVTGVCDEHYVSGKTASDISYRFGLTVDTVSYYEKDGSMWLIVGHYTKITCCGNVIFEEEG